MNIEQRLKRAVANSRAEVFVRNDFKAYGSPAQLSRVLKALVGEGRLVKVGLGVYAKARPSSLSGKPVPRIPLAQIALEAFKKLGIEASLGDLQRSYQAGETTQIPGEVTFNTGTRRISRKIAVGKKVVQFENAFS